MAVQYPGTVLKNMIPIVMASVIVSENTCVFIPRSFFFPPSFLFFSSFNPASPPSLRFTSMQAIYGLVVSVLIVNGLNNKGKDGYALQHGYVDLAAG